MDRTRLTGPLAFSCSPAKAGVQDRSEGAFFTSGSKTALSLKLQRGFWAPAFAGALRLASGGNRD